MIRSVFIAREDHERLFAVLERCRRTLTEADSHLRSLEFDMARAKTVPASDIPRNIVALYSWVRLRMSDSGHEITCQVVMPAEADGNDGRISVLSPMGATILGCRVGETVIVEENSRRREVTILGVFHHPRRREQAGNCAREERAVASERPQWRQALVKREPPR